MKTLKYMMLSTLALLLIVVLFGAYLLFWPVDPLVDIRIVVKKQNVAIGDRQCFTVTATKAVEASSDVLVELVNGEAIPLFNFQSNEPPGPFKITRCFNIPLQVEPSEEPDHKRYHMRLTAKYHLNPLRDVPEKEVSDCFNILRPTRDDVKKAAAVIIQDMKITENSKETKQNTSDIKMLKKGTK